ncbi:membrane protein [Caballeronia turbans]|jgi:drug/metabolite transporter (DMT)-like permease|uniref:DMT family transporter n=1 Tax=unclassified Caballeronia TaxID=2646786 RepID=UPI00074BC300|nr:MULTISPECIES: DMT family transporter [unclassified Caballeronia]SAL14515.1 membrane protein [Caballeronia turbans]
MPSRFTAILTALAAAALFGATTPIAKALLGPMPPFMVAGLFYLGSGVGLGAILLGRALRRATNESLRAREMAWLFGAIAFGGVAAPALLMFGLTSTPAATSSLLLNLEGVLTAVIAWIVFRENVDFSVFLGMAAIVAGGVVLAWQPGATHATRGALLIALACLCWAIDNNLTRRISTADAMVIACAKGLVAGATNLGIAFAMGAHLPAPHIVAGAMTTGFGGYGVSLVLFVIALRGLGTARTGAYFSVAPVFGVALSLAMWPQAPGASFWIAAALMTLGVWLHVRERHEHEHTHERLEHTHRHMHDEHHRHVHDFPYSGDEPHTHPHVHLPITHSHAHFPDIHHRHAHRRG